MYGIHERQAPRLGITAFPTLNFSFCTFHWSGPRDAELRRPRLHGAVAGRILPLDGDRVDARGGRHRELVHDEVVADGAAAEVGLLEPGDRPPPPPVRR